MLLMLLMLRIPRLTRALAAWNPGRPIAANLVFAGFALVFELVFELAGRERALAVAAGTATDGLRLGWVAAFLLLWVLYPLALHVKLPLVMATSEDGRQGRLGWGWGVALLVASLGLSGLSLWLVVEALGIEPGSPLWPVWPLGTTAHGLVVGFLYAVHLGSPPGRLGWRRRWEPGADLVLTGYVLLAWVGLWEGLAGGRPLSLAGYGWPAVLPELVAAVGVFWAVYFPLQAPFLLRLSSDLERVRGGNWWFRGSCVVATVAGLWPTF